MYVYVWTTHNLTQWNRFRCIAFRCCFFSVFYPFLFSSRNVPLLYFCVVCLVYGFDSESSIDRNNCKEEKKQHEEGKLKEEPSNSILNCSVLLVLVYIFIVRFRFNLRNLLAVTDFSLCLFLSVFAVCESACVFINGDSFYWE